MLFTSERPAVDGATSSVHRGARVVTMSERILGLDWATVLPWTIDDVRVQLSSFDEALPFITEHGVALFGAGNESFLREPMTEAKRRFCAEMDTFLLFKDGAPIGYWAGHPSDWTTYYARSMAILPAFRQSRVASELSRRVAETLAERTEVRRAEVDTSVANTAMTKILLGLGFVATSTFASERWGLTVRFTKFIDQEAGQIFARQFVNVPELGKTRGK